MRLLRPTSEQVMHHVGCPLDAVGLASPTWKEIEWWLDHRQFVLHILLPSVRPPERTWKLCVEAYLTDVQYEEDHPDFEFHHRAIHKGDIITFEQFCDGSSVVPNVAYKWGRIKDPWGVAHDLAYILHKFNLTDAFDHDWGLIEAHNAYRDGWRAQGSPVVGWTWWTGLMLGGWAVWRKKPNYGEPLSGTEIKPETGCYPKKA